MSSKSAKKRVDLIKTQMMPCSLATNWCSWIWDNPYKENENLAARE